MAYTNLNILKMDTGSHEGTWGTQTNYNWDRIDSYVSGYIEIQVATATTWSLDTTADATPVTGSTSSDTSGDGWNRVIKFTGSPAATLTVTINPSAKAKWYIVENALTTTQSITFTQGSATASLAKGSSTIIYCTGTNVYRALDVFEATTVNANLVGSATVGSGKALSVSGGTYHLNGNYPTGTNNNVIGDGAGNSLAGGSEQNVLYGYRSGYVISSGDGNVCIGHNSGKTVSTGTSNVFVGSGAGELCAGDGNVAVGHLALGQSASTSTATDGNSAVGYQALTNLTTGVMNSSLGIYSGNGITDGDYNVSIGYRAGLGGNRNKGIYIGTDAGFTDPGADSILVIDHEDKTSAAAQEYGQFIWGDMANDRLNFNSSNTGSHVKIQNTRTAGDDFTFLECIADADGSPATKFQVRGDGQVQVNGVEVHAADYADMFEWSDGNPEGEDRIGLTVVIDETSEEGGVRPATSSDDPNDVIGTVSGTACVIGNAAWKGWDKKYLKDDFGRTVTTSVDENVTPVLNPEYDEGREYVPRMARPDWAVIGLTGRIHIRKGALTHPSWRKIKNVSAVTEEWLVR